VTTPPVSGSSLAHPVSLTAIGLLVVNDQILKPAWPGLITGKLSDVAGLVFFPLLVIAAVELVAGRRIRSVAVIAIISTAVCFSLIQLWGPAADFYRHGLGYLQFPFRRLLSGAATPVPVSHTADLTDLLALPALFVAWRLATGSTWPGHVITGSDPTAQAELSLPEYGRSVLPSSMRPAPRGRGHIERSTDRTSSTRRGTVGA
jgi:hypothetical protein